MNDSTSKSSEPAAYAAPSPNLTSVGAMALPNYYSSEQKVPPTDTASHPLSPSDALISKRRKEVFGDCALIEIIHLHDCLRGALTALREDVAALTHEAAQPKTAVDSKQSDQNNETNQRGQRLEEDQQQQQPTDHYARCSDLERRVAGRFKVIWSVFRAHSSAEDEFIWPALRSKMQGNPNQQTKTNHSPNRGTCGCGSSAIVQEEYEEDHADEERMFSEMDSLLEKLRELIDATKKQQLESTSNSTSSHQKHATEIAEKIRAHTKVLTEHLMHHLEKEETQCMPLVVKHLSKSEIHDLVGNIMGKRSADTIAQIMTMAVQSLAENERQEMVEYMKQSMQNTFFDRWLLASGWGEESKGEKLENDSDAAKKDSTGKTEQLTEEKTMSTASNARSNNSLKRSATTPASGSKKKALVDPAVQQKAATLNINSGNSPLLNHRPVRVTSQAELEKLIRAIASNPALTPQQKNSTIQGLRDSVWKSNLREKERSSSNGSPPIVPVNAPATCVAALPSLPLQQQASLPTAESADVQRRPRGGLPPTAYYKKSAESGVELVWKNDGMSAPDNCLPLFSASELAPSFHDGAAGSVLGCPHYARACKLRHPKSGRLYVCRLCCDQARELPRGGCNDEKLDRYAVSEVMCQICNTLQPAEDRCVNPDCESRGKPFAKYFCRICHLYDDGSRPIFHCPFCNTCRLGLGLGIDYRHCMRCNACVSLDDKEHHCIPQKLQGTCPICHDTLFQSTEPLRGLKCGHVMHMTCFTRYRNTSYTCPLCMRSMEDMKDHFALLDAAIRMQPMPASFLYTMSNIYCQDCGKTGQVQYHFVGQKCPHCSSYNTREMGRVHNAPATT